MKKFIINYKNRNTSLNLNTTDYELGLQILTALQQNEVAAEATITEGAPISNSDLEAGIDAYPISLRRWTIHHYEKVSCMTPNQLYRLQTELVRDGYVRSTCAMSSVRTYFNNAVALLTAEEE